MLDIRIQNSFQKMKWVFSPALLCGVQNHPPRGPPSPSLELDRHKAARSQFLVFLQFSLLPFRMQDSEAFLSEH